MTQPLFENHTAKNNLYLCFQLDDKTYAVDSDRVIEIIMLPKLDYPQRLSENIVGILNYNSILINVVDIRKILNFPPKPYELSNQIIIIKGYESLIAVIVDKVTDFYKSAPQNVQTLTNNSFQNVINNFYNDNDKIVSIIDVNALESFLKKTLVKESTTDYRQYFPTDDKAIEMLEKRGKDIALKSSTNLSGNFFGKDQYIIFKLGKHNYCIYSNFVKELVNTRTCNITYVPYVHSFIKGVVNLKGEFYTVVSLKEFIGIENKDVVEEEKLIVLNSKDLKVVFLVDEIVDIVNIAPDEISNKNDLKLGGMFIKAEIYMGNMVFNILDTERLINDKRLFVGNEF